MHTIVMSSISIRPLALNETDTAAALLARAFVTNPLHVAAFGRDQLATNEAFFRIGLSVMKGSTWAAVEGTRMVGVVHWVPAPDCQFSIIEKVRMMPAMVKGLGLRPAINVSTWLSSWSKRDPSEPHMHVGPIAVDPDQQRRRIGHVMMDACCAALDRDGIKGVLETDRPENVAFYERFGFLVTATIPVLGVLNYFMQRPSR